MKEQTFPFDGSFRRFLSTFPFEIKMRKRARVKRFSCVRRSAGACHRTARHIHDTYAMHTRYVRDTYAIRHVRTQQLTTH
jgi:hypothetical protein